MRMTLRRTWMLALLLGAALGAVAYSGYVMLRGSFALQNPFSSSDYRDIAHACVIPEDQADDIFFISCGGIY